MIPELRLAGSYVCRFTAADIRAGEDALVQRETTLAFQAIPNLQRVYSIVKTERLGISEQGIRYQVSVTPRDKYGNYAGPGHRVSVVYVAREGKRVVDLVDKNSGTYRGELVVSKAVAGKPPVMNVIVDGKIFAELALGR